MNTLSWNFTAIFCTLFIFTFEFEYSLIPEIYQGINPLFENLVQFSGKHIFRIEADFDSTISSDTTGLFVHTFNLFCIAFIFALLLKILNNHKEVNLRQYLLILLAYYLSLQLLIYGFDKVFKAQFFYPEPNTLFTPLKDLSKDILYWSTMGMSRGYSIFLGGAEILVAVMLWFKKTRLFGALFGAGIMLNVVAINFGFDISVKVYSSFLLLSFILIMSPYFKFLYSVFTIQDKIEKPNFPEVQLGKFESSKWVLKGIIILLFMLEGLFPYFISGNYNDDIFPGPQFHGAYSVSENKLGIKRMFIHRHGYLIFQNEQDEFQDFQLELDTANPFFSLFDYRENNSFVVDYQFNNNSLTQINGLINGNTISLDVKKIYGK